MGDLSFDLTGFSPFTWTWASQATPLVITSTGVSTVSLWMREDGLRIDRLLITTDTSYIPTGYGPAETEYQIGGDDLIIPLTRTIVYTYDNLYRLTDADYTTGENYQYSYDPVGNRLQQIIAGDTTDYLYDAANRLAEVDGQSYIFDDNGNLLSTGAMTNTFDAANRLVETERNETTLAPIYNGVGDRIGQTVGVTTTYFALDVMGLPEVIYTSPSTGSGQAEGNSYLHLPGVIMTESAGGEVRYLLSDGLGSVRQATNETGEVLAYYEFDPYGNPVNNTTGGEPYGYTGEWYEGYINLLHLRTRWYAPESGTFLSHDQWPGDALRPQTVNPYGYVGGNPINSADPSGRCYPPIDFLRSIEGPICSNLDQAIYIYAHPYSSDWQRAGASFYISTWAVSHAAFLVGGTISGGAGIYEGVGAISTWGYGYLLAHPAVAQAVGLGAIAYSTVDDAATIYGAASGNPQAIQDAMMAQQMAANDGSYPFFDGVAGVWFFSKRTMDALSSCSALPGFTPEETRYILDALSGKYDQKLGDFVCFDSARCLLQTKSIRNDLLQAVDRGQFVLDLDGSTFKLIGELGNTTQLYQLESGDFLRVYAQ